MYERKTIDTSLPLDELVKLSDVTERAKAPTARRTSRARIREGAAGDAGGLSPYRSSIGT